jgi:hypothetical protein
MAKVIMNEQADKRPTTPNTKSNVLTKSISKNTREVRTPTFEEGDLIEESKNQLHTENDPKEAVKSLI